MRQTILWFLVFAAATSALGQSPDLTYQGRLVDGAVAASGPYDFIFKLFDEPTDMGGPQIGADQVRDDASVSGGVFTVVLNFGTTAFDGGGERYLEIYVRPGANTGPYTKLLPRQRVTSSPFSIKSSKADALSNSCVLCVTNAQILSLDGSKVTGTVSNAASATTAANVSGVVGIANGGTGSSVKNFVDLSTTQTIIGTKTFGHATFVNPFAAVEIQGELNVGSTVTADQFYGGGDGLINVYGSALVDSTVTTPKLADGSVTSSKLADGSVTSSKLAADATVKSTLNSTLLGSLRWDLLSPKTFPVGANPDSLTFDGANVWFANRFSNSVTKLRSTDGAVLGTFPVGNRPWGTAFDGTHLWVANYNDHTVTKLRVSDGAPMGTFSVGTNPKAIAFDGASIWVANRNSGNVTKLRASDGAFQGSFTVGAFPVAIAFDGANIWVANIAGAGSVTKLRASDGASMGSFSAGSSPTGLAFDGANVWVANNGSNNVTRLRASDGACVVPCNFAVTGNPSGIVYDGSNLWVTGFTGGTVTKLHASDGATQSILTVGAGPSSVVFDGANIWVTNDNSASVTKLMAFP